MLKLHGNFLNFFFFDVDFDNTKRMLKFHLIEFLIDIFFQQKEQFKFFKFGELFSVLRRDNFGEGKKGVFQFRLDKFLNPLILNNCIFDVVELVIELSLIFWVIYCFHAINVQHFLDFCLHDGTRSKSEEQVHKDFLLFHILFQILCLLFINLIFIVLKSVKNTMTPANSEDSPFEYQFVSLEYDTALKANLL